MTSDRGVSHAVGFVLTFGIILLSVALVSTVGFDSLNQIRVAEQQENAERAMVLLDQNVGEIQRGVSVRRSGEIDLNQGSFSSLRTPNSYLQVNVSGSDDHYNGTFTMSGVKYQLEESAFVYEGGALLRESPSGTTLVEEPTFLCTDDRALVSVVTVRTDGYRQVSAGTVTTHFEANDTNIAFPINRSGPNSTEGRSTVTIRLNSEYSEGWDRYLTSGDTGWEPTAGPANEYACDGGGAGVKEYTVVHTVVDFAIVR